MALLYYKAACHIQELNANHALSRRTLPIQESDAFVFSCSSKKCTAFWEEKKKDRKTGLWQKTELVTERDLSIAWTIPVSHPVIMGFITQPCTSLMLSLHLSLSLCMYAATGSHTLPHTHARSETHTARERETSCKQDIWQHLLFFCNLLKEMYASKQNVVNPWAWLFGLWEKNKTVLTQSNAKTRQQRNVKGDFNHRLLGVYRELLASTLSDRTLFI